MDPTPRSVNATSPSLLARVQANRPGSWERLVDLYAPLVYHWCRRSALSPEDAAVRKAKLRVLRRLREELGDLLE